MFTRFAYWTDNFDTFYIQFTYGISRKIGSGDLITIES